MFHDIFAVENAPSDLNKRRGTESEQRQVVLEALNNLKKEVQNEVETDDSNSLNQLIDDVYEELHRSDQAGKTR